MKSIVGALAVVVLLFGAVGCKKKETGDSVSDFKANFNLAPRTVSSAAQTTPPAPVLVATTAKIGPAGGTLNSSDGKLSVSIPAGALATETEVRIQPSNDDSGESFGPVYELSPEGTTFPEPVTLAWHLSEADLARTNLDNMVVRTKEPNGNWKVQSNVEWNEADHTIRASAKHFSQWDLAMTLRLQPSEAKVFIGDSLQLTAYVGTTQLSPPAPDKGSDDELLAAPPKAAGAASQSQSDSDDELLAAPSGDIRHGIYRDAVWRVNGQKCGTFKLGLIEQHSIGHYTVDDAAYQTVNYLTPDNVPSPNPVTVSFEITVKQLVPGRKGPATYVDKKMIATALITALPREDHWVGYSDITQGEGDKVSSQFTFAKVPDDKDGPILSYQILNGTVGYKGPKTVSGGACTLSIWPSSYSLTARPATRPDGWHFNTGDPRQHNVVSGQGGSQGMLRVDMSNPNQWLVSGQGESVWLATYTTHCANGDGSWPMGVHAGWWPINPLAMGTPTPVTVTPGKPPDVYVKIDGPMGTGTVHLNYIGSKPASLIDRSQNFYCQ